MPTITNSIGAYSFLAFRGSLPADVEGIERLEWPGVDYVRYRKIGKRPTPFQLQTVVDTLSLTTGATLLMNYGTLVGAGLQQLVYKGVDFDSLSLKVVVLNVTQAELSTVNQWGGGAFNTANKAKLVANWTLEFRGV